MKVQNISGVLQVLNTTSESPAIWHVQDNAKIIVVTTAFQILSTFLCLLIPIIFLIARRYTPELCSRVSFQLTTLLSVVELMYSASQIFNNSHHDHTGNINTTLCKVGVFSNVFFAFWSALVALCIGYNLLLVFVFNTQRANLAWVYMLGSFMLSLAMALPPYFFEVYAWDPTQMICWFRDPAYTWLFYGPLALIIAASTTISIKVSSNLRATQLRSDMFESHSNPMKAANAKLENQKRQARQIIGRLVSRLIWYPLVPLMGQFFNVISDVFFSTHSKRPLWIVVLGQLGTSLQGTLTVIIFFLVDPSWTKLYNDLSKRWNSRNRRESLTLSEVSTVSGISQYRANIAKFV